MMACRSFCWHHFSHFIMHARCAFMADMPFSFVNALKYSAAARSEIHSKSLLAGAVCWLDIVAAQIAAIHTICGHFARSLRCLSSLQHAALQCAEY